MLKIRYPIIQGGMVWVSGGKLAAAVARCGGLGVIGAGSMQPALLKKQIEKAQALAPKHQHALAVNLPLLYSRIEEQIENIINSNIPTVITSAGSPKIWTKKFHEHGVKVLHVTSSPKLAKKCEDAGVDAVIAEGFEAGGHNGREETTTLALIPAVVDTVSIPVIAAGGIRDGRGIAAAMALGASAVQLGTRFAASVESRAHTNFKKAIVDSEWGQTRLSLKKLVPVRLLENPFAQKVLELENSGASPEVLKELLGKGRAKMGMHDGNLAEGELEIGQVAGGITEIQTVEDIFADLIHEYNRCKNLPDWS